MTRSFPQQPLEKRLRPFTSATPERTSENDELHLLNPHLETALSISARTDSKSLIMDAEKVDFRR